MKLKLYSIAALLTAGLLMVNSANAQWNRNNATNQTYLANIGDLVGIGTTNPTFKLDVQSTGIATMSFKSTTDNASILLDRGAANKTASLTFRTAGSNNWQTGCISSNHFTIRNNNLGSLAMFFDNTNNNIGIQTNVPSALLNVINSDLTAISGTASFQIGLITDKNMVMDNDEIQARTNGVASSLLLNNSNAGNINMCNGNTASKGGSVFIGKALNYGRLNISADSSASGAQTVASFGTDGPGISIVRNWPGIYYNSYWDNAAGNKKSMAAGYGYILEMAPTQGHLFFNSTNTTTAAGQVITPVNRMVLSNEGRLGLGINSNPQTLFHLRDGSSGMAPFWETDATIESSNNTYLSLLCGPGQMEGIVFGANGIQSNGGIYFNDPATINGLQFRTNGNNTKMVITNSGDVGIGTQTPSYKLDVCGNIRAKEIRVETGWCDYVFANDYKLRPLSEVEAFINVNKHLPDVTSGPVIENEGLEVGKVSAQMIRKIEELTLYVIELQKQIDVLKTDKK